MDTGSLINAPRIAFATTPGVFRFNTFISGLKPCSPNFPPNNISRVGRPVHAPARKRSLQAVQSEGTTANGDTKGSAEWPRLYLKQVGTWEGYYRRIDTATGETKDIHRSRIEYGIRGDRSAQRNTYTWDDGRVVEMVFGGRVVDGRVVSDSEQQKGISTPVHEDVDMYYGKFKGRSGDIIDTNRLLSPTKRVRTWQIRDGDSVVELVYCEEEKISDENPYFEIAGAA